MMRKKHQKFPGAAQSCAGKTPVLVVIITVAGFKWIISQHTYSVWTQQHISLSVLQHTRTQKHTNTKRRADFQLVTHLKYSAPFPLSGVLLCNLSEATINPPHICSLSHTHPVYTPLYLGAPEFDSPVKGGRDEEVGEVYSAHRTVTADACNGPLVALEYFTDACFTREAQVNNRRWNFGPSLVGFICLFLI